MKKRVLWPPMEATWRFCNACTCCEAALRGHLELNNVFYGRPGRPLGSFEVGFRSWMPVFAWSAPAIRSIFDLTIFLMKCIIALCFFYFGSLHLLTVLAPALAPGKTPVCGKDRTVALLPRQLKCARRWHSWDSACHPDVSLPHPSRPRRARLCRRRGECR